MIGGAADLDAENLFREISDGETSIAAINTYYELLSTGNGNRAIIFKTYIDYAMIESEVLDWLDMTLDEVETTYPETYNFLMSLKDNLHEQRDY